MSRSDEFANAVRGLIEDFTALGLSGKCMAEQLAADAVAMERSRCVELARSLGHDHCAEAIEMGAIVMPVEPQRRS